MEYVYVLQEIDLDGTPTGHYKIGKTKQGTEERKRQYQAGNPRCLEPFHTIVVTNSQAVETELHHQFDYFRLKGYGGGDEWFNFQDLDMDQVIAFINQYDETPVYAPEPVYYESSYSSSSDFGFFDLLFNPITVVVAIVLGLVVVGSLSVNSSKQLKNSNKARSDWSDRSCIRPNGCQGTIDASSIDREAANIRSAPGTNSPKITSLPNGEKVTVFEESNGWIKIKSKDGTTGWVANNLVK